jgi:hypothetical protein
MHHRTQDQESVDQEEALLMVNGWSPAELYTRVSGNFTCAPGKSLKEASVYRKHMYANGADTAGHNPGRLRTAHLPIFIRQGI